MQKCNLFDEEVGIPDNYLIPGFAMPDGYNVVFTPCFVLVTQEKRDIFYYVLKTIFYKNSIKFL